MANPPQQPTDPLPEPYAFMAKTIMLPYALPPKGVDSLLLICRKIYEFGIMEGQQQSLMLENRRAMNSLDSQIGELKSSGSHPLQ
jgi:hypothetical protein